MVSGRCDVAFVERRKNNEEEGKGKAENERHEMKTQNAEGSFHYFAESFFPFSSESFGDGAK